MTIKSYIKKILRINGRHFLAISTTSNVNNPDIYFTSVRKYDDIVFGAIIINKESFIKDIIKEVDGKFEAIMVDIEKKNKVKNLFLSISRYIKNSEVIPFKPNEITAEALDLWISLLLRESKSKKIAIIGCGDLGTKTAFRLLNTRHNVHLWRRNKPLLRNLVKTFNQLGSNENFYFAASITEAVKKADLIIGCTPGIPIVKSEHIAIANKRAVLIDAGNGTFHPCAIRESHDTGRILYCLTPDAGYAGYFKRLSTAKRHLSSISSCEYGNLRVISPGQVGKKGDILVEDIQSPTNVIGVCDGNGDILPPDLADPYIKQLRDLINDKK